MIHANEARKAAEVMDSRLKELKTKKVEQLIDSEIIKAINGGAMFCFVRLKRKEVDTAEKILEDNGYSFKLINETEDDVEIIICWRKEDINF